MVLGIIKGIFFVGRKKIAHSFGAFDNILFCVEWPYFLKLFLDKINDYLSFGDPFISHGGQLIALVTGKIVLFVKLCMAAVFGLGGSIKIF